MNIREVRKVMGMSQSAFAARLGVSRTTVSFWELEKVLPSQDNLEAIARLAKQRGIAFETQLFPHSKRVNRVKVPKMTSGIRSYIPPKRAKLYVDDSFLYRRKE